MGIIRAFKRFWHDQITTPNGDIDGARVGLLVILVGACSYIYLEYYAIMMRGQLYDPSAFGDGLIKVGAAILASASAITVKSGTEIPYDPRVSAANFPYDAGAQAAMGAQVAVDKMSGLANDEINQVNGVWNNVSAFYRHVVSFFHHDPHQPPK